MLRTCADAHGFRKVLIGLLTGVAVFAIAVDSADARRRRHSKRSSSYNPPYAAIVVDANSGEVLHSAEPDAKRHPASLTKIMTLYLLFERLEAGKLKLDTPLKVSEHAEDQSPTKLGLKEGQTISAEDAILGLVTRSANDAAVVIAEAIAGDEEDFAKLMTRKARALGMKKTVYKNASGLPDRDQITTARDQAQLGRAIQDRFPKYYRYFSRRSFTFRGKSIRNHNNLLGSVPGVDGIKTGYIRDSGFNLVTSLKRDNRYLVAVVLGGKSGGARDARMRSLIEQHIKEASTRRTTPVIAEAPGADSEPITVAAVGDAPAAAATTRDAPAAAAAARDAAATRDAPATASAATPAPAKPISSTTIKAGAHRNDPATTAAVPAAKASGDPIKPIAVKTIKVKLTGTQTASLTPPLSHVPVVTAVKSEQTMQPVASRAPTPAPMPAPAPIQVASAGPDSIPVAAIAAVVGSAAAPAAAPPADEPSTHKITRTGWMIQVGAFEAEREAKDRLSSAQSKAKHLLSSADPFTETVIKDNKTFYRARFAGFDKGEAEAACKYLKRNDFACMTLKN